MAFIEKTDLSVINIKLTTKGRELLSRGQLKFRKYALGDSEINYRIVKEKKEYLRKLKEDEVDFLEEENIGESEVYKNLNNFGKIMKPMDLNPKITSFVRRIEAAGDKNNLPIMPSYKHKVINLREPIGYFSVDEEGAYSLNNIGDLIIGSGSISGSGKQISVSGTSFPEGTIILAKNNSGNSININSPSQILLYRVESASGSSYTIDRDFTLGGGYHGFGLNVKVGETYPSDYVFQGDGETLFFDNMICELPTFPHWKQSVLFSRNIPGTDGYPDNEDGEDKSYLEFKSSSMFGFIKYIQKQRECCNSLAVIHYTNPSPKNVYAEGFHVDKKEMEKTKIHLPTIMWHKSDSEEGLKMGLVLMPIGDEKMLDDQNPPLNITYYDLGDEWGNVVGKLFVGLKMVVIEDQELIFAISHKSNRNWTLPEPIIIKGGVN